MYDSPNYKTKRDLKAAIAEGKQIDVYQPGMGSVPVNGKVYLEGPHYPEPHKWYATGVMQEGQLIKVS